MSKKKKLTPKALLIWLVITFVVTTIVLTIDLQGMVGISKEFTKFFSVGIFVVVGLLTYKPIEKKFG